ADADAVLFLGVAPAYSVFKQLEPQSGPRLHVQDPFSAADAWLDAASAGPIDPPPSVAAPGRWWGISAIEGANLRPTPSTRGPSLGELTKGLPIVVAGWIAGEEVIKDNPTWAALSDSAFLYSSTLRPVALPTAPAPPTGRSGKWIDLNLTQQVVVAYEDSN